jgi:hypothetical protein
MDWKRPIPLWAFLVGLLIITALTSILLIAPSLLGPKPDFALLTKSNLMTINAFYCGVGGQSPCNYNTTVLTVQPVDSFAGVVSLTTLASNPALDVTVGGTDLPNKVLLGPATDLRLGVETGTIGNYTVTVTASSGSLLHTVTIPVFVQNLTLTASPSFLTIARGSSGTAEVDLASVNRLTGDLNMSGVVMVDASLSNTQYRDPDSNASFTPPSVALAPGGTAKSVLTITVGQSAVTGNRTIVVSVSKGSYGFELFLPATVV